MMRAVPSPGPAAGWRWLVVAASLLLMIMGNGTLFVLTVSLKPIAETFDWPREVPSLAYGLASFGAGLGAIYLSHLSERIGMLPVVLFGSVMIGTGCILASFTAAPWQLYAAYGLCIGLLGNAAMISPLMANASRWFDRRRGLAIAIVASGQSGAGTLWPPIIRLMNDWAGWRTTFLYYGILCLAVMLPLTLVFRRRPPEDLPPATGATGAGIKPARVLGWPSWAVQGTLCAAIIGCCIAMSMPITHMVAFATDLGHPAARAAELLSTMLAASIVSRLVGGVLADRIGGLRTLLLGSSIQAAMLAVLAFTEDLFSLYVVAALFGIGYGGIIPMYAFAVREYFPVRGAARRIAIIFFFGLLAMAVGSWTGGYVYDQTGSYRTAFLIGASANLTNLLLLVMLVLRTRRFPAPAVA